MKLNWVVERSGGNYAVGIRNSEIEKLDQVCLCVFEFDAEMIKLALEALVDPREFYRTVSPDPKVIIKGFKLIEESKGDRIMHARSIG